ncbi:hypothetical protein Tco_1401556 [Tanacetum coccineum]
MDSNFNNENDSWEFGLDIDDSDLYLTSVLRSSNSTRVEPSPSTPNPVRMIPGLSGIVQLSSSIRVEPSPSTPNPVRIIPDPAVMSTQEYMKKVVEGVGDDEDFKSGSWVSATDYVHATGGIVTGCLGDIKNFLKNEKLEQVAAIVKSCSPNGIGDLTVTMKNLSEAAMILVNVSVFTPKPSKQYLNIIMRNVVKVFRKDTVPGSGSG